MEHKPYPSDLTDEQWAVLQPLIPPARPGGRPRKTDMRRVLNALFYHTREGGSWRALPHDFPPWKTVCNSFQWWTWDGTWQTSLDALRPGVRTKAGREPTPKRRRHRQPVRPDGRGRSAVRHRWWQKVYGRQ